MKKGTTQNGPRRVLSFIWGLFKNNLLLKIMAVLFAVVLWSYVLAETDPLRERVFNDIPIKYSFETLEAQGLAVSYSLSDYPDTVDVRVEVKQSNKKNLTSDNVKVTVDLSSISGPGVYTLPINASGTNCNVIEKSATTVTLYIDNAVTNSIPIELLVTGNPADGYYAGVPVVTPDVVILSGASSDVGLARRAECPIDISGLTGWNKTSMDVTILDRDGNALDPEWFGTSLPSAIVDISILPVKTVPVDVEGSIIGGDSLAPGYWIVGDILCDPPYVRIVGAAEDLAGITAIPLAQYSISGASSDVVALLDFAPPEGVTVLDEDNKAQVTIAIREMTASETYEGIGIDIRNLKNGLTADLSQSEVDVTALAGVSAMSRLRISDIVPYVDLNGFEEGTYTVDILYEFPQGFAAENFTASVDTVTVKTITVTISRG